MVSRVGGFLLLPVVMWCGFVAVSIYLGWVGYIAESVPYGDVSFIYEYWATRALTEGQVVGLNEPWVYPLFAMAPMVGSALISPDNFAVGWIILVTFLNALVFGLLLLPYLARKLGREASSLKIAAWWWLVFMAVLGPIAVSRLESVVSALAIAGMLLVFIWPKTAGALLAMGAWIKVWPAAIVFAAFATVKTKLGLFLGALYFSLGLIVIGVLGGGVTNLFSFLGQQTSRGIQIESPLAAPFLWLAINGNSEYGIYYDTDILTYQASGLGVAEVAFISNAVLGAAVIGVLLWGWWLSRRGIDQMLLFPLVSFIVITALIVFNKVGSPQYMMWLVAPVVAGLIFYPRVWRSLALLSLLVAGMTHVIYPYWYGNILVLDPPLIALLTLRNIGLVSLLVVSSWILYAESKREIWAPTKSDSIKNAS
jgi:hypothetical protein